MKKAVFICVFACAMFLVLSSNAQSQGDLRASVGISAGTKASLDKDSGDEKLGIGINAGVEYFFIDNLSIAPSYSYFLPTDLGSGVSFNSGSLNIDARYYFSEMFYGMAGYASYSNKLSGGGATVSVNEGAFNVGAGAMIAAGDAMNINVQLKYQSILDSDIDFNQIVAQASVVFVF